MEHVDGFGGRLEVSRTMSFGDHQWRPALFVPPVPDFDLRAVVGKELHHLREILQRRSVHGGLTVGIDHVHVRAQLQEQFCRLDDLRLFAGNFGRLIRTSTDRGAVICLDSRILKKGYGKSFLRSLPPCQKISGLDELAKFFSPPAGV